MKNTNNERDQLLVAHLLLSFFIFIFFQVQLIAIPICCDSTGIAYLCLLDFGFYFNSWIFSVLILKNLID